MEKKYYTKRGSRQKSTPWIESLKLWLKKTISQIDGVNQKLVNQQWTWIYVMVLFLTAVWSNDYSTSVLNNYPGHLPRWYTTETPEVCKLEMMALYHFPPWNWILNPWVSVDDNTHPVLCTLKTIKSLMFLTDTFPRNHLHWLYR